jgi:cytochrome bd ubiquinol oxidase subunit I
MSSRFAAAARHNHRKTMSEGPLQLDPIVFPLLGNSLVVGAVALLHIALASLAVAFMMLTPIAEIMGNTRPWLVEAAHAMTRFTIVTYTANLVLAVIMIDLFIGLFPLTNAHLFNYFRAPLYVATGAFLLQLFALYPYYHYWDAIRAKSPRLHITLGIVAALLMLVWVAVLDGMGSYMLTPTRSDGAWGRLSNPTWASLVLHRFLGNLVLAGYVIAGYAAWRLRGGGEAHSGYYLRLLKAGLLIGLLTLMMQPLSGWLYANTINDAAPEAYRQLTQGSYQVLLYVQFTLIGGLFLGSHLWLQAADPDHARRHWSPLVIGMIALAMVLSVGHPDLRRVWTVGLVGVSAWALYRGRRLFSQTGAEDMDRLRTPVVRHLSVALALVALVTYWTMGTIRETARRPDTIRGTISLQDESKVPAVDRSGTK